MKRVGWLTNDNLIIEMTTVEWYDIIETRLPQLSAGEQCVAYRKRHKLSQATLAEAVGISRSYLSQIERGEANISLAIHRRILAVIVNAVPTGEGVTWP